MATKYIRANFERTEPKTRFYHHATWFTALNGFFVLTNLWAGNYPWSIFLLALWGIGLAIHAVKIYNENAFRNRFYIHFIVYAAIVTILFVTAADRNRYYYGRHYRFPFIQILVASVWTAIVAVHFYMVRRWERRQTAIEEINSQPQTVDVQVEQQGNETQNEQLIQNEIEVHNTIQLAQEQQRNQQQQQLHLFQKPPQQFYPNVVNNNNNF
jgi:hypothetical protein